MRVLAVLALLVITIAGLSASTQYVAARLHYAPGLGPSRFVLGDVRVYAPWAWVGWTQRYGTRAPTLFRNAGGITTIAALVGCVPALLVALRRKRSGLSTAHGSSRWATTDEIRKAGLLRDAGVVLCQTSDALFVTHVDAAGKTRTTARRLGPLVRHDGPRTRLLLRAHPQWQGRGTRHPDAP
jgi:type IV secretory pathway TraG/TraD family ATPase VirD4